MKATGAADSEIYTLTLKHRSYEDMEEVEQMDMPVCICFAIIIFTFFCKNTVVLLELCVYKLKLNKKCTQL